MLPAQTGSNPIADAGTGNALRVSFIIPSYNSGITLPLCLHSIRRQLPAIPFEVIVADSSDDGTAAAIAAAFPEVRFLHLPSRTNPAAARNRGLEIASAPWCAFVDADVVLTENWLATALGLLSDEVGGICSSIEPYPEDNPLGFCYFLIQFSMFLPSGIVRRVPVIPSFAFLSKCSDAREAGGFPEDFPILEDFLFSRRLTEKTGRAFLFCPAMRAFHINRRQWGIISKQLKDHGSWSARARRSAPLPGTFLGKFPAAVPLLVPYRLGLILARTLRWNPKAFVRAVALSPILIAGLAIWAAAFYRETTQGNAH